MDEIDEIVQEFLVESHENLDQLDRDLVALEREPDSRDLLASIFRTIHTIKGTSGFLAFGQLESVTHVGENLLARLRDGKMSMTPQTTDVLLAMVDAVRDLLRTIEERGDEGDADVSAVVEQVTAVLEGRAPAADASSTDAPATDASVDAEDVAQTQAPEPVAVGSASSTGAAANGAPHNGAPLNGAPLNGAPLNGAAVQAEALPGTPVGAPAASLPNTAPAAASQAPAQKPAQKPAQGKADEHHDDHQHRRSVAESSIRVDVDVLDSLMQLVGELVLTRNQIVRQAGVQSDPEFTAAAQRLNLIASELQEGVMKTRMQPIDHLWAKLPRVVRDLGAQCGKSVTLEMVGKETELDRSLLEAVKDPLTHLVRNSVDHGFETPAERVAAGKPAEGRLTLRAYHEGGQVVVEVSDDGAGIDPAKISGKAVEKGLRTPAQLAEMSHNDILQLIFAPGFSTAQAVTNVSGRGVGMDVVRTNIEAIGGAVEVESVLGKGTTCRLRIPLTLAIVPALTVECAGDRYAIPQVSLLELVALDADRAANDVEDINGASVYRLRGSLLPLVRLADLLDVESDRNDGHVVIAVLQAEGRRFGLVIDRVLSTEEIVVKPLGSQLKAIGAYSGATILGDGTVALILDVQTLARRVLNTDGAETEQVRETEAKVTVDESQRLLVAGLGADRRVAIPLSSVTRLENFPASTVERVGGREVVQYRGSILPLVRLGDFYGTYSERTGDELVVVIYTVGSRSVAIVVDEIVDIVEEGAEVRADVTGHGVLGSTVVRDRLVEVLDVRAAILSADPTFYSTVEDELLLADLQETM